MYRKFHAATLNRLNFHLSRLPTYASIACILGIFCFMASFLISSSVGSNLRNSTSSIISGIVIVLGLIIFAISSFYIERHTIDIPNQNILLIPCGRRHPPEALIISSDKIFCLPSRGDEHLVALEQSDMVKFSYCAGGSYVTLSLHVNFSINPNRLTNLGISYLLNDAEATRKLSQQLSSQYLNAVRLHEDSIMHFDCRRPSFTIDHTRDVYSIVVTAQHESTIISFDVSNFGFDSFIADMQQSSLEYTTTRPDGYVFFVEDLPHDIFKLHGTTPHAEESTPEYIQFYRNLPDDDTINLL